MKDDFWSETNPNVVEMQQQPPPYPNQKPPAYNPEAVDDAPPPYPEPNTVLSVVLYYE